MNRQQIAGLFSPIPTTYEFWPIGDAPDLPYICYYYPDSDDFFADNENYVAIRRLNIELYTDNKDFTLEDTVEGILKANHLGFSKTETYIEAEHMYQTLYQTEVLLNG
jgi:hypothetical protein